MRKFFLLTAFLILANTAIAATANQMQAAPWPTEVGWSARYQIDGEWLNLWDTLVDITEEEDGWKREVHNTMMWSDYLSIFDLTYLRSPDGDVYLESMDNPYSGEYFLFDPPVLYLDLPLAPGKTWEFKSTRYTERDTISEHHRFTVEKKTIEISGEKLSTFYVFDDPVKGEPLGGDYYLPGFGPVAFDFPADDLKLRMTGNSVDGFDSRLGVGESLKFSFGWQAGMSWDVVKSGAAIKSSMGKIDTTGADFTYTMVAEYMPRDLLIRNKDLIILGMPEPGNYDNLQQVMLAQLSNLQPSYIVNSQGAFQALANKASFRDSLLATMAPFWESDEIDDDQRKQQIKETIDQMISPDLVEILAQREWDTMIGAWCDWETWIGEPVEITFEVAHPLIRGLMLEMTTIYLVTGRCPCDEDDTEYGCVEAVFSSYSAPNTDGSALIDWLKEMDPTADISGSPRLSIRNSSLIRMEADGMFPHHHVTSEVVEISGFDDTPSGGKRKFGFFKFKRNQN